MTSVVVIGNGMAGARLVEELRTRDRDLRITVLGSETQAPYNRILLSDLLAGRAHVDDLALTTPGWYADHDVTAHLGVTVTSIDRDAREVRTDTGLVVSYDVLVLATGSTAWVPPIDGLLQADGALVAGAHVFRTVDDCAALLDAAADASSALVLGGGLLGLEAARGLAARGLDVEVLHPVGHLMERQLDGAAGHVLARTLQRLGVRTRLEAQMVGIEGEGRLTGVRLATGDVLQTDMLVVACGVRPETGLARSAGLAVDRGVVVDDQLRTCDPAIFAIGECAQHQGTVYGLVAPAWEQAVVVADVLTGTAASYAGSRLITRLKAAGVDLAAMGEVDVSDDDADVVQFTDLARGTYKKLVIRDGRLTGAILLGDGRTAGSVVQLYDRGGPVPSDPVSLLFAGAGSAVATESPALMPNRATVCHCNGVTKAQIQDCWLSGHRTVGEIAAATRATTGCGTCKDAVTGICDWLTSVEPQATEVPA